MMDAGVLLTLVGSVLSGGGVLAVARLYLERRERRATEAESTVDELAGWAHDLVTRWPEVRQSVTPPELPPLIRRRWAKTGGLDNG